MISKYLRLLGLMLAIFFAAVVYAGEQDVTLDKAPIDVTDQASLQRGARTFMNYCSGCHTLKFTRYESIARDLEIVDDNGKILKDVVKQNLMFSGSKLTDSIINTMQESDAESWFGIYPPDLSLVARSRGVDWIYTFLRSFYADGKRPWGVNNRVFEDTAMPNILAPLQDDLSPADYNLVVADLVNFLAYTAEPQQTARRKLGVWVLVFVGIFVVFTYLLKREYWKDIN